MAEPVPFRPAHYYALGGTRMVAAITHLEGELAAVRRAAAVVPPEGVVDLVAQAIHSALCTPLTCVSADMYDAAARAVLVALAGAGRLRDEGDGYWMGHDAAGR